MYFATKLNVRTAKLATSEPHLSALEDLPLYLPRLFYAMLGLVERRLSESGLNAHLRPGMGHVLLALYEEDDCIIRDISRRVQITNGTLTGLLQRMEKARLVECRKCAQDGRAVRVRLAQLGRSLEARIRQFHRGITQTVQAGLKDNEIATAHAVFERMLGAMRADEAHSKQKRNGSRKRAIRPRTKRNGTKP
jgi:DNA-binding MarR family transcriptional regulator